MRPYLPAFLALLLLVQSFGQVADSDTVVIEGHEAAASTIIAKWTGTAETTTLAVSSTDSRIARAARRIRSFKSFRTIKRLSVLAFSNDGSTASDRALRLRERIQELKDTGLFEYVEPDYVLHAYATPSDTAFTDGRLWGLRNTRQNGGVSGADIDAVTAWNQTTGSHDVVVGVVDSGIRYTHQDIEGNIWTNPNEIPDNGVDDDDNGYIDDVYGINARNGRGDPMDDNNHGSHCAGAIGATANDSGPHVGVAWQVSLMALKFLDKNGSGTTSNAIECIDYAIAEGADILSNSWGGSSYSSGLYDAINRAQSAGILFVAASGNDGTNTDASPAYPAGYSLNNIISVAALDRSDKLASFSNYGGASVDIGAPGVDIYSCTAASDTSYATYDGTSMAAPYVSGVAVLVKAKFPNISVAELKQRLLNNARSITTLSNKTVSGGAVSASGALGSIATDPSPSSTVFSATNLPKTIPDRGSVTSTLTISGVSGKVAVKNLVLNLSIKHPNVGDLVVKLKNPNGKSFTIWNRQGGDQDDLTLSSSLSSSRKITVNGTWTLTVEDKVANNTGTLNSWSIAIQDETGS